jgi:diguanylate cyclase (GGDEF)-like protein/PAS domain S-box-containing protein
MTKALTLRPAGSDLPKAAKGRAEAADMRHMAEKRWRQFLVLGLAGVVGVGFAPITQQPVLTLVLSALALVAMRRGTRAFAGGHAKPWNLLRYGGWMFILAQLVRAGHAMAIGQPKPFPSPADPVFYLGYALLIAGVVSLVRRRRAQVEGDNLLDALILATCVGVFATAYVLVPYVESIYLDNLQKTLSVAYTLCDLILIGVTVRLAVGSGRRPASYYLLGCAWGFALLADVLVTVETMGIVLGPWTFVTSALSYVFLATSAMHPSMALLAERPPAHEVRLTRGRLLTLFLAMALVPAALAWETLAGTGRSTTYAVGSVVMAMLVLSRLAGLVRSKERKAEREAVLRAAASSFAGTLEAETMLDVAVETLATIVCTGQTGRASLATVDGTALRVVASTGYGAREAFGSVLDLSDPEVAAAVAAGVAHAAHLPAVDTPGRAELRHVLLVPLVARSEVRGAFVVTVDKPVPFEVVAAVGSLADQLSVALEANALADEIARRRHERRFRALVENGSDLVTLVDATGTVFFASPACEHLLGVPETALVGEHPFALVHPDDRYLAGSLLDAVWTSSREGEPIESRFRHADGTWRWFEVVADNLLDEPDVAGVVVHFRDITDRKRAQLELQENAARFRSLVQHASDLVVVLDGQAKVTYVSPSVMRVLGYLQEEVLDTSALLLAHPDDAAGLPAAWDDSFTPLTREIRVRRRNGDWAVIEFTASDLRREPGVEGVVLNGRDVTDRKTLEAELRRLALHDGLTGLPNRTLFLDRVEQALSRDARAPGTLAVLYVDLDDFKTINDGLGHVAGDALLRAVAGRLQGCIRHQDTAARLGGDEFGILLDDIADAATAAEVAGRIGEVLAQPFVVDDRQLHVTATVGLVVRTDEVVTTEALLRRADVAMYLAKTRGKNRVQAYETGMDEQFRERLELKGDLSAALEQQQFRVVYQPIVDLATGDLDGFEALVRWQHPERGLVPPNVFVPIAEETGDIVALGQWVLQTACDQLGEWQRSFGIRPRMSVNLSIRQLEHPGLIASVRAAVASAGIAAGDLTLEITESVLAEDVELVRGQLIELRDLGVKVAIDDFGTGYSSFSYLSQFAVDVLKIDRSFVMHLAAVESEEAGIVTAIVALARSRGLRTVAEGIEETVQADVLRELGCDTGQGYLYARPLAPADLDGMLAEARDAAVARAVEVPRQRRRSSSREAVA